MLNYIVVNSLSEYFMIETSKLILISPRINNANDVYISLFGELKIIGSKGYFDRRRIEISKDFQSFSLSASDKKEWCFSQKNGTCYLI